ncbi:MAG TPA: ABC-type transport auxiliary lipoprotein family protein [Candidatus Acidoferrum sp.]|nr:ABC-type transport auxiliary lipoprotein family protein [Candidatus Acidoferrum sp.]
MICATGDVRMRAGEKMHSRARGAEVTTLPVTLLLPVMIAAVALSGCGATRPSKYYQLTVPNEIVSAPSANAVPVTLLVGDLMTSHLYREDRIVYSSGRGQMGTYEYQRWAEPPTEMVEEVLVRELRASGRYRSVYAHRSNIGGDFLLRGRLYDFKEVYAGSMVARVSFELELRDLKSGATVWTHSYTHDEPVSGKEVTAIVEALDKNVQAGVKEIVASLGEYFATHPVK